MKTSLILSLTLICFLSFTYGQNLSQFYKNETVKLEEVPGFAEGVDWNDLFSDYPSIYLEREFRKTPSFVVAPDGSIFMSHKTHYDIWKFDKDGRLIKRFGSKGTGKGQFVMRAKARGVLGGKYLYTTDAQGRMLFFDLEGNYVKSHTLDYMPLHTVALNDMKIAIFGHVPWKNHTVRYIVSIKDFESGQEKIIWDEIYDPLMNLIELPDGKQMFAVMNVSRSETTRFGIAANSDGNLIVVSNKDGTVTEYSTDGIKIRTFPLNIDPVEITDADIERIYQTQINNFARFQEKLSEGRKLTDEELELIRAKYKEHFESLKEKIKAGDHLPLYSTIVMDSDGNVLVFEFTEEKDTNKFNVYSYKMDGTLIGVSSFESKEYDLTFTHDTFVFHEGYVYAMAVRKNADGVPLRLVKFKLAN
jgi:hypothetical protein